MLRAIVLGIVQGLTEFLPISSSAHLAIVPRLLGYPPPALSFEILLHFGTLAAVVAYFARDLWSFVLSLVAPGRLGPGVAAVKRRLLVLLATASVPAAALGYVLSDWADGQTSKPLRASIWLMLTTVVLVAAELYAKRSTALAVPVAYPENGVRRAPSTRAEIHHRRGAISTRARTESAEEEVERLPTVKALGIGLAQALALIPGTSRSGITISAGLFQGVSREAAARFSFLLSIPAILGAGILKVPDLATASEPTGQLVAGFLAAAIAGFVAVSGLLRLLRTRTLWPFIWYRLIAGSIFVLLLTTVRS
ncbi:MAG TPA: undecaprenyl-diphosphate phosphatase [Actinomycetes bacterium]|nr:undecaprenyl-diphosphate phosphatase [Actinomycetes bacterium]